MISKKISMLFCATLLAVSAANAEQIAIPQGNDARIQVFDYNPADVFLINTKVGYSTLVQLEEGEKITDDGALGMGDAKAWSLAVRGNNILFKPIVEMPDTNMLVVTNRRTYAFRLTTNSSEPTYIARFDYEGKLRSNRAINNLNSTNNGDWGATQNAVNYLAQNSTKIPDSFVRVGVLDNGSSVLVDSAINLNYEFKGSKGLKPTNVWDNSLFTFIRYADGRDLPTFYRVMPDGQEMLVNTHIQDDVIVLQETNNTYRLRLGSAVADISTTKNKIPAYNPVGTSDSQFKRIDR